MPEHRQTKTSPKTYSLRLRTCKAENGCKYACNSSKYITARLAETIKNLQFPAKIKLGIAACPRCCTIPKLRDLGLIGTPQGWEVHFGGNGGYSPRIALELGKGLSEKEACDTIRQALSVYLTHAGNGQRTSKFLDQFGEKQFLNSIGLF